MTSFIKREYKGWRGWEETRKMKWEEDENKKAVGEGEWKTEWGINRRRKRRKRGKR